MTVYYQPKIEVTDFEKSPNFKLFEKEYRALLDELCDLAHDHIEEEYRDDELKIRELGETARYKLAERNKERKWNMKKAVETYKSRLFHSARRPAGYDTGLHFGLKAQFENIRDFLKTSSTDTTESGQEKYLLRRGLLVAFLEDRDGGIRQCSTGTAQHLTKLIKDMNVSGTLTLFERFSRLFDNLAEEILIKNMRDQRSQLIEQLINKKGMSQAEAENWLDKNSTHVLASYKEKLKITPENSDPYAYKIIDSAMAAESEERLSVAFRQENILPLLLEQGPFAETVEQWKNMQAEGITYVQAMDLVERLRDFYRLGERELSLYDLFETDDESRIKTVDPDTLALRLQVKLFDLLYNRPDLNSAEEPEWKRKHCSITAFLQRLDDDGSVTNAKAWIIDNVNVFAQFATQQGNPVIKTLLQRLSGEPLRRADIPDRMLAGVTRSEAAQFLACLDNDRDRVDGAIAWIGKYDDWFKRFAQLHGNPLLPVLALRLSNKTISPEQLHATTIPDWMLQGITLAEATEFFLQHEFRSGLTGMSQ